MVGLCNICLARVIYDDRCRCKRSSRSRSFPSISVLVELSCLTGLPRHYTTLLCFDHRQYSLFNLPPPAITVLEAALPLFLSPSSLSRLSFFSTSSSLPHCLRSPLHRHISDITASKRRKITPRLADDTLTPSYRSSGTPLSDPSPAQSPQSSDDPRHRSASPLPAPQPVPLSSPILPARSALAKTHYDTRSGGYSSPSEAYAGLSLDNNSDMVTTRSDKHGDGGIGPETNTDPKDSPFRDSRSSSPAKRRFDDIAGHDHMDLDDEASKQTPTLQPTANADQNHSTATTEVDEVEKPSLDEQVEKVMAEEAKGHAEEEGHPGYIISKSWFGRVIARTKFNEDMGPWDKSCLEGPIGPVDNSSIISDENVAGLADEKDKPFIPLRKDVQLDKDIEILPESAWNMILSWYDLGPPQQPIIRYRHQTNANDPEAVPEWQYELFPPVFTLRKVQLSSAAAPSTSSADAEAPKIITTRNEKYVDFVKKVKKLLGIPLQTKIAIGRVLEIQGTTESFTAKDMSSIPSPPASRPSSPTGSRIPMIIPEEEFNKLLAEHQIEHLDVKDDSTNENYNGKINLDTLGLRVDQVLVVQEGAGKNKGKGQAADTTKKGFTKNLTVKNVASAQSSRTASPAGGMMTRGRFKNNGRSKGTVGLTNLGNTCYMNSALQCMRACQELTLYFLSNRWKKELNAQNPLGHKGQIANVYADLLKNIYDGTQYSFTPRNFKTTLGKFAPMFSGYGQQDSQEFMSFLVDGLHEDLNRILKKPYTENPESDDNTVNDPNAIKELGEKYREIYQARNSSVITDLFSGSYKNKLVCPVCNKISVNFDPFLLLTLQLPIEHHWEFTFTFVPLHQKPRQIRIDNSKGSSMRNLKEFVASRVSGLDPDRLLITEIFSQKLYRVMDNQTSIPEANIQSRDDMVIYELEEQPTNYPPPPRKYRSMLDVDSKEESPPKDVNEQQLVMMLHRAASSHSYSYSKSVVLWPNFIMLNKEEASSYDEILRKILLAVSSQTVRDLDGVVVQDGKDEFDVDDDSPPEYVEGDMSMDEEKHSNIKAESLEDEDFVDVKMTSGDDSQPATSESPSTPHWSQKGAPIPESLRNLFEICYAPSKEPIPTGYTQPDYNTTSNYLKDRIPQPPPSPEPSEAANSPEPMDASEDESPEEAFDRTNDSTSQTGVIDSDAESSFSKPGSGRNRKVKSGKNGKNRGKKFAKQNARHSTPKSFLKKTPIISHDSGNSTDGRLIRNNEIIFLDWKPEAYKELFDASRGGDARKNMETLPDPELDRRSKLREFRRERGVSLQECFEETSKAEVLTEDNAWYCPSCKERRLASKQLELWTVPDILVIHLKRFSSGRGLRDKLDVLVDFPIDGLDLTGKVGVDEGKNLTYDLFAVDNHYGGLGGGHYTAFAKNFVDEEWYDYNDSSVTKREARSVISPAAYLLFYRRRSDHPLGSPELQKIVENALHDGNESDGSSSTDPLSGNGLAGDSYRNGSSSALVGPVAARPHLAGGSARSRSALGAEYDKLGDDTDDMDDLANDNDDPPPLSKTRSANSAFGMVDEAIEMGDHEDNGEEVDLAPHSISHNVHNPVSQPTWSFGDLNKQPDSLLPGYDDDNASNQAADGDDEDEDFHGPHSLRKDYGSDEDRNDGGFVHQTEGWSVKQVEESRRPSSLVGEEEQEDVMDSVESH